MRGGSVFQDSALEVVDRGHLRNANVALIGRRDAERERRLGLDADILVGDDTTQQELLGTKRLHRAIVHRGVAHTPQAS